MTLVDASLELAEQARERLLARRAGTSTPGCSTSGVERTASIEVAGELGVADLVIEAVPEDLELKQQVLGAIEPGPIIATNTSSLPIGELAASVRARSASSACTGSPAGVDRGDRTRQRWAAPSASRTSARQQERQPADRVRRPASVRRTCSTPQATIRAPCSSPVARSALGRAARRVAQRAGEVAADQRQP